MKIAKCFICGKEVSKRKSMAIKNGSRACKEHPEIKYIKQYTAEYNAAIRRLEIDKEISIQEMWPMSKVENRIVLFKKEIEKIDKKYGIWSI